jgi:hypothetical protein
MARLGRISLFVCVALAGLLLAVSLAGCGGYGGGGGKTNTGNTGTGGGY